MFGFPAWNRTTGCCWRCDIKPSDVLGERGRLGSQTGESRAWGRGANKILVGRVWGKAEHGGEEGEQKEEEVPYPKGLSSEGSSYPPAGLWNIWNIAGGPSSGMSHQRSLSVKDDREEKKTGTQLFSQNQRKGED